MRAKKKDANHNDIGNHLRSLGWSVLDLSHAGRGIPDMAVGRTGFACLVECKDGSKPPSARKLTKDELRVMEQWDGPYIVATSPEDAEKKLDELLHATPSGNFVAAQAKAQARALGAGGAEEKSD